LTRRLTGTACFSSTSTISRPIPVARAIASSGEAVGPAVRASIGGTEVSPVLGRGCGDLLERAEPGLHLDIDVLDELHERPPQLGIRGALEPVEEAHIPRR